MATHTTDGDCEGHLDDDGTCMVCGVYHGDPCAFCGGRGFHRTDDCPNLFDCDSEEYKHAAEQFLRL